MQTQSVMVNSLFLFQNCSVNHWYQKNIDFWVLVNNQYLYRCVLWGAHSVTDICHLPFPHKTCSWQLHIFTWARTPRHTWSECHFPQPLPDHTRATWARAQCSEEWGRWRNVKNHGVGGTRTQGAFLQEADDKGGLVTNWRNTFIN